MRNLGTFLATILFTGTICLGAVCLGKSIWWWAIMMPLMAGFAIFCIWSARHEKAPEPLPGPASQAKIEKSQPAPAGTIEEKESLMKSLPIKEHAGEKAHPLFFWLGFAGLAYAYVLLAYALFRGLVFPVEPIVLSPGNAALNLNPDDFPALFALVVFIVQHKINQWRPAGWLYGFWDFCISLPPIVLTILWIGARSGLFTGVPLVGVLAPSATHYALMSAVWFGIGGMTDFWLNFSKGRRSQAAPASLPAIVPAAGTELVALPALERMSAPAALNINIQAPPAGGTVTFQQGMEGGCPTLTIRTY